MITAQLCPVSHMCAELTSPQGVQWALVFTDLKLLLLQTSAGCWWVLCARVAEAELSHGNTGVCQKDLSFQQL